MSSATWYIRLGGQVLGPISDAELRDLAMHGGVTSQTPVSKEQTQWIPAAAVAEIVFGAAPAVQAQVPQSTPLQAATGGRFDSAAIADWKRLQEIARWHRRMLLAVLVSLIGWLVEIPAIPDPLTGICGRITVAAQLHKPGLLVLAVPLFVVWVWLIAKLAQKLGLNVWLYAILGAVPFAMLFAIVSLGRKAAQAIRAAGIKVGFLGTKLSDQPSPEFLASQTVSIPQPTSR